MEIAIETLKQMHKDFSNKCAEQYKKINTLLRKQKFEKVDAARNGYQELWTKVNKMEDFLKTNNINYWTNYEDAKITNPNIY